MTETGPAVFRFDGSPFPFFIFQNCNWHVKMRLSSLWINTPKENTLSNVVTLLMFFFIDFLKIATLACPLVMLPHLQDTHHPRSRIKQHWFFFTTLILKDSGRGIHCPEESSLMEMQRCFVFWQVSLKGDLLCLWFQGNTGYFTEKSNFVIISLRKGVG